RNPPGAGRLGVRPALGLRDAHLRPWLRSRLYLPPQLPLWRQRLRLPPLRLSVLSAVCPGLRQLALRRRQLRLRRRVGPLLAQRHVLPDLPGDVLDPGGRSNRHERILTAVSGSARKQPMNGLRRWSACWVTLIALAAAGCTE